MPHRVRHLTIASGLALVALAVLWHYRLADRWTQRIPPGRSGSTQYTGDQTFPDPVTKQLPERDRLATYERSIRVISEADRPRSVLLEDRYTVRDLRTGVVIWQYLTHAAVDPRTGAHVAPQYRGHIALFPRNVERRTYVLTANYMTAIPLAYERTDSIDGLEAFVFAYRGAIDYSDAYRGWAEWAGVTVPRAHAYRCADDQFYYRVWVEPATGNQIRLEEGCPSGTYLFDGVSGERLAAVDRWSGVTEGDDLLRRTAEVHKLRAAYLRAARDIPLALLVAGVLALGIGARGLVRQSVARRRATT